MRWIDAALLDQWATRLDGRKWLSEMIGDLVRASVDDVNHMRFPSGDKSQVRGLDGDLNVVGRKNHPYVPDGYSIWEIGTNEDYLRKVNGDYESRVNSVDDEVKLKATLVLVTPRTWDKPKRGKGIDGWVAEKRAAKRWKDIKCIDGVQLERWLGENPAVAARYASTIESKRLGGAYSSDDFWQEYTGRYRPTLSENVILAGRANQATLLIDKLLKKSGQLLYKADSADEAIAFAVAAIRSASPEIRFFLESRTIIVDEQDAVRELGSNDRLIFIPRGSAKELSGYLSRKSQTIVATGASEVARNFEILVRPAKYEIIQALKSLGLTEEDAAHKGRACGRSLTILARLMPFADYPPPEWTKNHEALMPALFAGAWSKAVDKDKAILSSLKGCETYVEVERPLLPLQALSDSPIDIVSDVIALRSSVDVYVHLEHLLDESHLSRFQEILTSLFSAPYLEPEAREAFSFQRTPSVETCSNWLREGMMTTLLHMAVLPRANSSGGKTLQAFVDRCVRQLPGLSSNYRLMASLKNNLALLAEASPDSFLDALEQLLEGAPEGITPIFDEGDALFSPTSPHVAFLWALETVAWNSKHLARAVECLAKLSLLDPGGKTSNRPLASLKEIFVPWVRNVDATLTYKRDVLRNLIVEVPDIAWRLLEQLLPGHHETSTPTALPRFREDSETKSEFLSFEAVWEAQNDIVELALAHVEGQVERWLSIIKHLSAFPPPAQNLAIDRISAYLEGAELAGQEVVWKELRRLHRHHSSFPQADWALKGGPLNQIQEQVEKYTPTDSYKVAGLLFDEANELYGNASIVQTQRSQQLAVLRDLVEQDGFAAIAKLLEVSKRSYDIFEAVAALDLKPLEFKGLIEALVIHGAGMTRSEVSIPVYMAYHKYGENWLVDFRGWARGQGWSDSDIANSLLGFGRSKKEWHSISTFGLEVDRLFWCRKTPTFVDDPEADGEEQVERFLGVKRAFAALQVSSRRLDLLTTKQITACLDLAIAEFNAMKSPDKTMPQYLVEGAFDELYTRQDISDAEVARIEIRYLSMWLYDAAKGKRRIHKIVLSEPEVFIELIRHAYRRDDEEVREPTEDEATRAELCWRLLSTLENMPGQQGGQVDPAATLNWVQKARRLANEQGVTNITDILIGKLIAHAPASEAGIWPHEAARAVIEHARSKHLESGVRTERYNMRGVTWRSPVGGGFQERALAKELRDWGASIREAPRTVALLNAMAEEWDKRADEEDILSEQRQLK